MTLAEKYVYTVYRTKSFSSAARTLFVSQPALSATVARQEKELGFSIFDRSTSPLSLTAKGRIYIEALEEIAETERTMRLRIEGLDTAAEYDVLVGGSIFVAQHLLPFVCGEYCHRRPAARISIDMSIYNSTLEDKLSSGTLDLLMCYSYDETKFDSIPLFDERRIIAVPKNLLKDPSLLPYALTREQILSRAYAAEDRVAELSLFQDIPFLTHRSDSRSTSFMHQFLSGVAVSPHTILNCHSISSNYQMMSAGMGATVTTETIIATLPSTGESVSFFVPAASNAYATVFLAYAKRRTLSSATKDFIRVATEMLRDGAIYRSLL